MSSIAPRTKRAVPPMPISVRVASGSTRCRSRSASHAPPERKSLSSPARPKAGGARGAGGGDRRGGGGGAGKKPQGLPGREREKKKGERDDACHDGEAGDGAARERGEHAGNLARPRRGR